MADLGDMADQLLQAASQLSPLPKTSGSSSSRARREHGRDDSLRGGRGRSLPLQPGRSTATTVQDEPDSTRSIVRRRGNSRTPSSASLSIAQGVTNGSLRSVANRGDAPQQTLMAARHGDHHGHGHQHQHQHRHQQGRVQPPTGGSVDSDRTSSYFAEKSVGSSTDRGRDRDSERDNSHHRSNGYNNKNYDAPRRSSYDGGGNRSRSSSPAYSGLDIQGHGSVMDNKRSSGGGEWHSSGICRSSSAEGGEDINGIGDGKEHGWQNSFGGGTVLDEQNRGNGTTASEAFESQLRRPRSDCGSDIGGASGGGSEERANELILVDSNSGEEEQQNTIGAHKQDEQQQQHCTSQKPPHSPPLPPPTRRHVSPCRRLSAQSDGSLASGSSSGSGVDSSTARESSTSSPPPQAKVSRQALEERRSSTTNTTNTNVNNNNNNNNTDTDTDTNTTNNNNATIGVSVTPANIVTEALPVSREAVKATLRLKLAGSGKLGCSAGGKKKREIVADDDQQVAALRCPHADCRLRKECRLDPGSMSEHLAVHMRKAAEQQITRAYVRSTVAELLHELCTDVAVARREPTCVRRHTTSTLFGRTDQRLGFSAAMLETKVLGDIGNPAIRRCTSEIAFGSCEGVGSSDQIVRCDTCGAWSHVYCGGVSIGGTVEPVIGWSHSTHPNALASEVSQCSQPEAAVGAVGAAAAAATTAATAISPAVPVVKEEHICRTCARAAAGSNGGDGPPWTVSTLVGGRVNRKRVLRFLEREATEGWPIGVFDFNMCVEKPAVGADLKRRPCSREGCDRESRFDSRFCCDACGVLDAESLLADAVVYSLEGREGRERGKRLRATRLARIHRTQVAGAARISSRSDLPALETRNEEQLRMMVNRKWRLWKRLIEIGAYWEKVSGSKNLLTLREPPTVVLPSPASTVAVTLAARNQAMAAVAAAAAARNRAAAAAARSQATAAVATVAAATAAASGASGAPSGTASDVVVVEGTNGEQQQQPQQQQQNSSGRAADTGAGVLAVMKSLAARCAREARAAGTATSPALPSSQRTDTPPITGVSVVERQPLRRAPPARQSDEEQGSGNADGIGTRGGASAYTATAAASASTAIGTAAGSRDSSEISDEPVAASVEAQAPKAKNGAGMTTEERAAAAAGGKVTSVSSSSSHEAVEPLASATTANKSNDRSSGSRSNEEANSGASDGATANDESNMDLPSEAKNPTASNNTSSYSSSSSIVTAAAIATETGKRPISATAGEGKNGREMEVDVAVGQVANAASAGDGAAATGQQQTPSTTSTGAVTATAAATAAAVAAPSNDAAAAPSAKRPRIDRVPAAASRVATPAALAPPPPPAAAPAGVTTVLATPAAAATVPATPRAPMKVPTAPAPPPAPAMPQHVQARQGDDASQAGQGEVEILQVRLDGVIQRAGAEEQTCPYCGDESGPDVAKHLEECYQQVTGVRNARLSSTTMRPPPVEASTAAFQPRRMCGGVGLPSTASGAMTYASTVARQLLQRRVAYADFAALPDSGRFQLHRDLHGWTTSPSRLDLLHKELVRQRNVAMLELQALERDEALLELKLRREWAHEGFGGAVSRIWRSIGETSNNNNNNSSSNPVVLD